VTDSPDPTPAKRQQHAERNTRLARAQQARAKQQPPTEPAAGQRDNDPPA
jgi:hypothetical protein